MRAAIESVSEQGATIIVVFKSDIGSGKGIWKSRYGAPRIGAAYTVELDVSKPFELVPARSRAGVELVDERILLTGLIEAVDEDEVAWLRIAPDCLMLIGKSEHRFTSGETVTLRLETDKFQLTPFGFPPRDRKQ